jgi:peroxiredoxin
VLAAGQSTSGSSEVLREFRQQHDISLPLIADPSRRISRYFPGSIFPRTYVINRDGKIVFELFGTYGFSTLVKAVEAEVRRSAA